MRFLRLTGTLGAILCVVALGLAGGCSDGSIPANNDDGGSSPSVLGSAPPRVSDPITARWPAGLQTVVAAQGDQLCVVDAQGIVFREASPPLTVMARDEQSATFSYALSGNGEYIAYLASREELLVRATATGQQIGSVPMQARSEMVVAAVSDDGNQAVVVSSDSVPEQYHTSQLDQTVTLCNVARGSTTVSPVLCDYATEAAATYYTGLYQPTALYFLPGGDLVVSSWFGRFDTCVYDPTKDALCAIDGLDIVWSVSSTGTVLGAQWSRYGTTGELTPVSWADGKTQTVSTPYVSTIGLPSWGGTLSRDGTHAALVVGGNLPQTLWWQAFRFTDGRWDALGETVETPETWIQLSPVAISEDGATVWGLRSDGLGDTGGGTRQYPISADTATGVWTYWLQADDLQPSEDDLDVLALILSR
jgi:hypothetical protein